jgi:hypothetical protein
MTEENIMYETENFYIYKAASLYEIIKKKIIGSYVVGTTENLDKAIRVTNKLQMYPDNV